MKLTVEGLNKKYAKTKAVCDFSTEFKNGIYGLLGANGAGKTTLIKLLCGILKKDSGYIKFNDKEIEKDDIKYKSCIGYLPQQFMGYPEFTALDFLKYMAAIKGVPDKAVPGRTKEVLEKLNLFSVKDKKIKSFSGGMRRRLGIAQALINHPKIFLLDEPTTGLDPKERVFFRNIISDYGKKNIVILSTHIVSDVEYIANEILIIKGGKLINKGDTERLVDSISGKVWEYRDKDDMGSRLKSKNVVNIRNEENGEVSVRLISEKQPIAGGKSVKPTLEDLYLYYFDEDDEKNE